MATMLTTWEQAAQFDPTNPNQKQLIYYTALPGGYSSFYYNQVPTTAQLNGLRGLGLASFSELPTWAQAASVAVLGVVLGFVGKAKVWPWAKPKLGLSGRRR
jgi:hypothetical protein